MGKSSAIIADSVRHGRPILHVDLMGVTSEQEVTERFRWAWQFFVQQAAGGFWKGVLPELSATIPGTGVGVKIGSSSSKNAPASWGDVLVSFDKETGKTGGLLFIDEMQDLARLPDGGQKMAKSLRAALQMARHVTPVFAGSVQHLLAPFFATSAAAFFKSVRLQHHLKPFEQEAFGSWASRIFRAQKRQIEDSALTRLFELTEGVTEDLVATCAEIWVQDSQGRSVAPADVEVGWRNVVANAAQYFLPRVSALSGLQARFLRHVARNPRAQPFAEETLAAIRGESGPAHRALRKLIELELLREEQRDGRRSVWVHDARLAFYLRA
jgi:chromosome segregation and condensation protein ScpB